ncbi:lipopolysaccharide biosynthesis protein [Marinoscillum sp. MHG1-6]|uniref:lipopolysaccharide biosynthesis protein n=1 Tax=Marinoscillum sp. MHG1-6 TaxID=2959627 RepID=UPI0021589F93|nr:oligosaccharide flippase family protein [Marinoscillum sp. MHG1-6]
MLKDTFISIFLKGIGVCSSFLISVYLGRELGLEDFGRFEFINNLSVFILVLFSFGMPHIITREVAIAKAGNQLERISNIFLSTQYFCLGISVLLSLILVLCSPFISSIFFSDSSIEVPLALFVISVVLQSLTKNISAALNGFNKVWQGNLFDQVIGVFLICIGIILFCSWSVSVIELLDIAIIFLGCRIVVFIVSLAYWKHVFEYRFPYKNILKKLKQSISRLFLLSITANITLVISPFIIGFFCGAEEIGLFSIAQKLAFTTVLLLQIVSSVLAPKIAEMYNQGKRHELKGLIGRTSGLLLVTGASILGMFVLYGKVLVGFWGEEFLSAYPLLIILAIGQFVNMATGVVGITLIMTGHDRIITNISVIFVVLSVGLNLILVSEFGVQGAAYAIALVLIVENLFKFLMVKKLKIV